jgi:ketosteroid isomerase-like protein
MRAFKEAVQAGDFDAVEQLLADDCRFTSPVAFAPYEGKAIIAAILRGVSRVFTDFRYVRVITDANGRDSALVFEAGIRGADGVTVNGCDFIRTDEDGKIVDFMVMVRPLRAAEALAAAMAVEFEQIQAEAMAAVREQ